MPWHGSRVFDFLRFAVLVWSGCLWVACQTAPEPIVVSEGQAAAVLGPSDVVEIRVFGEPELSGVHQVTSEGTLRLPLIGTFEASGLTGDQLGARIEQAYNGKFLRNSQVTVVVKEFHSRKVYVLGEVKSPGPYQYEDGMTIIGVIARAGGITRLGDANRTLITRGRDGQQLRLTARVSDISRGSAPNVEILPGDIIFVPETLF
jgi:polysaccharide export outer membrane protein